MAKPWIASVEIGEYLTLGQEGIEPLGQVFGCSVVGYSIYYAPATTSEFIGEVNAFQQMLSECLAAITDQATAMGANGILDCRLTLDSNLGQEVQGYILLTMKIVGVAVHDSANSSGRPYSASIDAAGVVALHRAGYAPCGFVVGYSSYYQVAWRQIPTLSGPFATWGNEEILELTQGPYTAREIATGRLVAMAQAASAIGVVGVNAESTIIPSGTLQGGTMAALCRMTFVGTAIRTIPGTTPKIEVKPILEIGIE